jgi:hypothetical protein
MHTLNTKPGKDPLPANTPPARMRTRDERCRGVRDLPQDATLGPDDVPLGLPSELWEAVQRGRSQPVVHLCSPCTAL